MIKTKEEKLKQEREKIIANMKIIYTPKLDKKDYFIPKLTSTDEINKIIEMFIITLRKNIEDNKLSLLYRNLVNVKIKEMNSLLVLLASLVQYEITLGSYCSQKNQIEVLPLIIRKKFSSYLDLSDEEFIFILYHELLHLSSSYYDIEKGISFSGFSQYYDGDQIGNSLDEGYTDLLTYRYFIHKNKYLSYPYLSQAAYLVEKIIGHDMMTTFYFEGDLYSLVLELAKYSNIHEVKKFIYNLDYLMMIKYYRSIFINEANSYHFEIVTFLLNTYQKKLDRDLEMKRITIQGYEKRLNEFMKNIHSLSNKLKITLDEYKKRTLSRK